MRVERKDGEEKRRSRDFDMQFACVATAKRVKLPGKACEGSAVCLAGECSGRRDMTAQASEPKKESESLAGTRKNKELLHRRQVISPLLRFVWHSSPPYLLPASQGFCQHAGVLAVFASMQVCCSCSLPEGRRIWGRREGAAREEEEKRSAGAHRFLF